jgi:hypothetical protein
VCLFVFSFFFSLFLSLFWLCFFLCCWVIPPLCLFLSFDFGWVSYTHVDRSTLPPPLF